MCILYGMEHNNTVFVAASAIVSGTLQAVEEVGVYFLFTSCESFQSRVWLNIYDVTTTLNLGTSLPLLFVIL